MKITVDAFGVVCYSSASDAGWSSSVARRAHNPKVIGSNPVPATSFISRRINAVISFKRFQNVVDGNSKVSIMLTSSLASYLFRQRSLKT